MIESEYLSNLNFAQKSPEYAHFWMMYGKNVWQADKHEMCALVSFELVGAILCKKAIQWIYEWMNSYRLLMNRFIVMMQLYQISWYLI